jgi:phosphatidylserine/phosphatidylglycerophosphate/cardiolipin synthase-like enzyme
VSLTTLSALSRGRLLALARLVCSYEDQVPPGSRLEQVVGADSEWVARAIEELLNGGWSSSQISASLDALGMVKDGMAPVPGLECVLSGPSVRGIPTRDTSAVVQSLLATAEHDVLIVGYAFYKGAALFQILRDRWVSLPEMRVRMIVDVRRPMNDTSLDDQIVSRFASDFRKRQWPWTPHPEIFCDPRALSTNAASRASMHAKCVIVDRRICLITSANFTPAAQERNVEVGVLIRDADQVRKLADYFDGLIMQVMKPVVLN